MQKSLTRKLMKVFMIWVVTEHLAHLFGQILLQSKTWAEFRIEVYVQKQTIFPQYISALNSLRFSQFPKKPIFIIIAHQG